MKRWPLGIPATILLAIVAISIAIGIGRVVQQTRQARSRVAVKNDLKQIMEAMHNYHDAYDSFPPAFTVGPDGKRWHSWRALILPQLAPELAARYRFDEPWDGPNNSLLHSEAPDVLQSDSVGPPGSAASYFAVVGKRTLWPAYQAMRLRDIIDGSSNTLAIVEDSRTDICWLEPRDLLTSEFLQSFYEGDDWHPDGGRMVAFADGTPRYLSRSLDRTLLASLLTADFRGYTFSGNDWPADLISAAPVQPSVGAPQNVDLLPQTEIAATADQPLNADRNHLWSASFQMAWDQLKQELGGPVLLEGPHAVVDSLNATSFDTDSLSPMSTFTAVTTISEKEDAELIAQIREKFPDVRPKLHDVPDAEIRVRLYSLIRKQMPFEVVFDRLDAPLDFQNSSFSASVNSFGHDPAQSQQADLVYSGQVEILDDLGDDDFIVRLNTSGDQQDQIVLAMIPAEKSLQAMWQVVQHRITHPNPRHDRKLLESNETLQIPVMEFSLQKHFAELEGQSITGLGYSAVLALAFTEIRLRLDETGADFLSVSEAAFFGEFGGAEFNPDRVRRLIVNRPFFVALTEAGAAEPYFLAWIANPELMEPFSN